MNGYITTPRILPLPFLVLCLTAFAADLAAQQAKPARVGAQPARATQVAPAEETLAAATRLDGAIGQLRQSSAFQKAAAAVQSGQAQKVQLGVTITPIPTSDEGCVCSGGKGTINNKPVDWPCDCSPAGCGTCGGSTLTQ